MNLILVFNLYEISHASIEEYNLYNIITSFVIAAYISICVKGNLSVSIYIYIYKACLISHKYYNYILKIQ